MLARSLRPMHEGCGIFLNPSVAFATVLVGMEGNEHRNRT